MSWQPNFIEMIKCLDFINVLTFCTKSDFSKLHWIWNNLRFLVYLISCRFNFKSKHFSGHVINLALYSKIFSLPHPCSLVFPHFVFSYSVWIVSLSCDHLLTHSVLLNISKDHLLTPSFLLPPFPLNVCYFVYTAVNMLQRELYFLNFYIMFRFYFSLWFSFDHSWIIGYCR